MKIHIWGIRGSTVCGGVDTSRYGGNTTCIAVTLDNGQCVIMDAGSGLRGLGVHLVKHPPPRLACMICLSHGHWDHIMGLPFFAPLFDAAWEITLCGPERIGSVGLEAFLRGMFSAGYFPVTWEALPRQPRLISLFEGQPLLWEGATVMPCLARHGQAEALAYRLEADGQSLFYSGDHELGLEPPALDTPFFAAMRGAQVAIVDAQYMAEDYPAKQGWGHSFMQQWPPLAEALGVGRLILSHFDASYDDDMLDDVAEALSLAFSSMAGRLLLGYEGMELDCGAADARGAHRVKRCSTCDVSTQLSQLSDMALIYDTLLTQARALTQADAGTLYLKEEDNLVFSYSQNETLFSAAQSARQQYLNARLPIDATSIAGFVALHGVALNLPDVRQLSPQMPFRFNEAFDKATGYRTVSMYVIPLHSRDGVLVGVMQLINSTRKGKVLPFTATMQRNLEGLCLAGAQAIERGLLTQSMILRTLSTAALRDPTETGPHVLRVGAMTAELYQRWAENRGMDIAEILPVKAQLRLAAMLHDVGKVGISDRILKKPGRLTPEEREVIETHCALGAGLFADAQWDMDAMAEKIALHHHQKWDGTGYGGQAEGLLAGEGIPFEARLTAIADVFDALVSPRCYKEPWPVEKAVALLQSEAGRHFDPDMVQAFVEIQDTMLAIHAKYPLTGG